MIPTASELYIRDNLEPAVILYLHCLTVLHHQRNLDPAAIRRVIGGGRMGVAEKPEGFSRGLQMLHDTIGA